MTGWTPHYVDGPVHEQYSPMCFGGDYLAKPVTSEKFVAKPIA